MNSTGFETLRTCPVVLLVYCGSGARGQRDGAGDGNRGPNPDVPASVRWAPQSRHLNHDPLGRGPGPAAVGCASAEWAPLLL
ncbi:unnamed protein product [Gadus morhua 'NCC']